MTDGEAAEILRIVRRLRPGTVVTYGDVSREVYGHTKAGPAVGQVIRAETDNAERDGRPGSFPWWRVVSKGLRPHEGADGWLAREGVTLRPGGSVHPKHHAPKRVGAVPGDGRPTIEGMLGRDPEPLPEWLDGTDPPRFDRGAFFASRTVYYPGSGEDGQPLRLCNRSRSAHCFVYVDHGDEYGQDAFGQGLLVPKHDPSGYRSRIRGYGLARWEPVPVDVLRPGGWTRNPGCHELTGVDLERREDLGKVLGPRETFAFFAVMDRTDDFGDGHGAPRLAILFIGGDGFAFYDALYCQGDGTPPPFLATIQDHGFGGNWDRFGRDGLLERIAGESGVLPEFLLVGESRSRRKPEPLRNHWKNYTNTEADAEPGGMHGIPRRLFRREGA